MCFRISSPARLAGPALLAACLLAMSSCTDDPPSVVPSSSVGVVEGYVIEAGRPVAASIRFTNDYDDDLRVRVVTSSDSTGWYHVELPLGVYGMRITASGNQSAGAQIDTVRIGRAVRRKDLVCGRASLDIDLPASLEGRIAWLDLYRPNQQYNFYAQIVDSSATFDLRLLPVGAYSVRLDVSAAAGDVVMIQQDGGVEADSLRVQADAPAHGTVDFRSTCASLSGRVTSSPAFVAQDISVQMIDARNQSLGTAYCASDGSFRCDFLVPQAVRLRIRNNGLERWFGGDDFSSATVFSPQSGQHLTGVDLSGGGLRIRFEGPGDYIDNEAVLQLRNARGDEYYLNYLHGNPATVELLAPGPYTLFVYGACAGQPWQPQWYDGVADPLEAATLEIADGQMRDVTLSLTSGGRITGTFVSRSGDLPWSVSVALCDTLGHQLCPQVVRVGRSQMSLVGLRDGDYHLALYVSSSPWWYPGTWLSSEATTISIRDGGTVSGLVWQLPFPYKKVAP